MKQKKSNSWKMERASVTVRGKNRPRSNKYSGGDSDTRPKPGERSRAWVAAYDRADGTHVTGHYRKLARSQ